MNLELNCSPLSEMIFCGRPNRFHTSAAYLYAVSLASILVVHGINIEVLVHP